jgi:hypothetical protein
MLSADRRILAAPAPRPNPIVGYDDGGHTFDAAWDVAPSEAAS